MDEGGGGENIVQYHSNVAETQKSNKPRLIWLVTLGVVILILLTLSAYFIFRDNLEKEGQNNNDLGNENPKEVPKGMEDCLNAGDMNSECIALFGDYEECDNWRDLNDQCLFYTALNTEDYSLCASIEDSPLKTKCEKEVMVFGEDI